MKTLTQRTRIAFKTAMIGTVFTSLAFVSSPHAYADVSTSPYWTLAQETHNFIVGNLITSSNSYRTAVGQSTTTEWYDASQIYADAAMVKYGDSRYVPYMDNTYAFMNNLWASDKSIGGYYAQANADGTGAGGDQYVDDNALTGNAYLDAYAATTGSDQAAYLQSAEAIANWLMNSGLWDSTAGGGFWWTTNTTTASSQVKATEVNGLACEFFLRLYQITGQSYYKQWADSIKNWLDTELYDKTTGLYNWQYEKSTSSVNPVKFTYDNAIMIEVDLLYNQITGDSSYVTSAESLADNMIKTLWNTQNSNGAFIINTSDPRLNPCYSGWGSEGLLALYQKDGNVKWLNYAKQNIDTLNEKLRDTSNDGYYNAWTPSTNKADDSSLTEVSQAWMERIQAMLANDISADTTPPTTTATLTSQPNAAGWYNKDVPVTFNATDNDGGSGVAQISYSASGADTIPLTTIQGSTGSMTVTTEGSTTISYYAEDAAGNTESARTLTVNIDKTPPTISITSPTFSGYVDAQSIPVTLSVYDAGSGVQQSQTTIMVDGNPLQSGTPLNLSRLPLGTHQLTVSATDQAGNTATQSVNYYTTTSIDSLLQLTQQITSDHANFVQAQINNLRQKLESMVHALKSDPDSTDPTVQRIIQDLEWLLTH